jgi:peptidoglycan/LPS O-acetylase OafA/YrhL
MTFHYAAIVLMAVGAAVFVWISRDREWSTARSLTIGGSAALAYIAAFLAGQSAARKLDWKLFGKRRRSHSL